MSISIFLLLSTVTALKLAQQPDFNITSSEYDQECGDRMNYKCWKKGGHGLNHGGGLVFHVLGAEVQLDEVDTAFSSGTAHFNFHTAGTCASSSLQYFFVPPITITDSAYSFTASDRSTCYNLQYGADRDSDRDQVSVKFLCGRNPGVNKFDPPVAILGVTMYHGFYCRSGSLGTQRHYQDLLSVTDMNVNANGCEEETPTGDSWAYSWTQNLIDAAACEIGPAYVILSRGLRCEADQFLGDHFNTLDECYTAVMNDYPDVCTGSSFSFEEAIGGQTDTHKECYCNDPTLATTDCAGQSDGSDYMSTSLESSQYAICSRSSC